MKLTPMTRRRALSMRLAGSVLCLVVVLGMGTGTAFAAADTTPPTTGSDVLVTYFDSATINLYPSDEVGGSGVDKTYYRIDEAGDFVVGTSVTVATVGNHTIEWYSVDLAGNREGTLTWRFRVDSEDTTIDEVGPMTTSNSKTAYPVSPAVIVLTAIDNPGGSGVASVRYRIDGGVIVSGASPLTVSVDGSGGTAHTLQFWAVDVAGNIGAEHIDTFTIGSAPVPALTIKSNLASARIGKTLVLSGAGTPTSRMAGRRISVMVKRPGRPWSTASTRILSIKAAWSCNYSLKKGMAKGTYQFKAVYVSMGKSYVSRVLKVTVR